MFYTEEKLAIVKKEIEERGNLIIKELDTEDILESDHENSLSYDELDEDTPETNNNEEDQKQEVLLFERAKDLEEGPKSDNERVSLIIQMPEDSNANNISKAISSTIFKEVLENNDKSSNLGWILCNCIDSNERLSILTSGSSRLTQKTESTCKFDDTKIFEESQDWETKTMGTCNTERLTLTKPSFKTMLLDSSFYHEITELPQKRIFEEFFIISEFPKVIDETEIETKVHLPSKYLFQYPNKKPDW